ncbi:unnamed protein product [Onchocerca flexuosa]|uniref:SWIB domain-containing protein n=1 Tax=Onchocerca flexuosa TaxID=387005 RepID=A0A183H968_9BILA|nr:unnamed protein product [Onchocerca flexuosa]
MRSSTVAEINPKCSSTTPLNPRKGKLNIISLLKLISTVKSIGSFAADKNIKYSASIAEFIKKTLSIDPAYCIIHFLNLNPEDIGCNGTTMKELMKK